MVICISIILFVSLSAVLCIGSLLCLCFLLCCICRHLDELTLSDVRLVDACMLHGGCCWLVVHGHAFTKAQNIPQHSISIHNADAHSICPPNE